MNIGKSIKIALAMNESTQVKLSEYMGVTQQTMTSWVKGKTSPSLFQVLQMAIRFKMKVSEFIALGEEK